MTIMPPAGTGDAGDDDEREHERERNHEVRRSASTIGYADEDEYDPGWLGVVLRWPVRVVAVAVIMPIQVVWESAKAATRATGYGLRRIGRGIGRAADRFVGRPLRAVGRGIEAGANAVGRGIGWVTARVLWWPLRWFGRGSGRIARIVYGRILRPVGQGIRAVCRGIGDGVAFVFRGIGGGIAFVFRGIGRGIAFVGAAIAAGVLAVVRPIGRGIAFLGRGIRDGLGVTGRAIYRWLLRPIGRGIAFLAHGVRDGFGALAHAANRWLLRPIGQVFKWLGMALARLVYYLFVPVRLAGRGIWFVLCLFGRWLVGLAHVIGEAFVYAGRVGSAVGRGVVWLWTTAVWNPVRWVGRGLRTAWLSVWHPLRDAARRAVAPIAESARGIRRWYRHEISDPIRAALSAARRDVRRALPGRRRG